MLLLGGTARQVGVLVALPNLFSSFVIFTSLMSFSVNVASPFFAVFMLKDLSFSYFLYTFLTVTAHLTLFSLIWRWGRHADIIGNRKVITFTAPLIATLPLLWIINRHPLFLFGAQVISGFAWLGFSLASTNFIYDAVMPPKRVRCIAYFNFFNPSQKSPGFSPRDECSFEISAQEGTADFSPLGSTGLAAL